MPIFTAQKVLPLYDAKARDTKFVSGVLQTCHYVDHLVHMGMMTPRGSWKSTPEIGNDLHAIVYLGTRDLGAQVERCVREAQPIAALVRDNLIQIVRVSYDQTLSGALFVALDYVNLALDKNKVQRANNGVQ